MKKFELFMLCLVVLGWIGASRSQLTPNDLQSSFSERILQENVPVDQQFIPGESDEADNNQFYNEELEEVQGNKLDQDFIDIDPNGVPMNEEEVSTQNLPRPKKKSHPPFQHAPRRLPQGYTTKGKLIEGATEILMSAYYALHGQKMRFVVDSDDRFQDLFYFLEVYGRGKMGIAFYANETEVNPFARVELYIGSPEDLTFVPIDPDLFSLQPGYIIELQKLSKPETSLSFSLQKGDRLIIEFEARAKVMTRLTRKVFFQVGFVKTEYPQEKDYRLQFICQSSMERQKLTGYENLQMFINKGHILPSEKRHDTYASGFTGTGLIKTISKKNSLFCMGELCEFSVKLSVEAVEYIYFLPSIFENNALITFDHYLYIIEELEVGEVVSYEFDVPKFDTDWKFAITPIIGTTKIYINPDFKPLRPEDSKYASMSPFRENILITDYEAKKFKFEFKKFFMTFVNSETTQPSVFKVEIIRSPVDSMREIKEDVIETGVVAKDEIINYHLDLLSPQSQSFSFSLSLHSYAGSADFYLKECLKTEKLCTITAQDVEELNKSGVESYNKERIMKFSKLEMQAGQSEKDDQISLDFNCIVNNQKLTSNYPNSETCLFAIGVHCRQSNNEFGTFYRFEARGQSTHHPMVFTLSKTIILNRSQTLYYEFDLTQLNKKRDKMAGFRLITLTGKVKLFFSRTNPYPSQSDNEMSMVVNDVLLSSLHAMETDGVISLFEDKLNPTSLYLTIEASAYSVIDLYSYLFSKDNMGIEIQETTQFNKQIHRKLNSDDILLARGQRMHIQNFLIDVPNGIEFTEPMTIHLNSDAPGFRLCLQVNVVMFDKDGKCDFESDVDILKIPPQTLNMYKGSKFGFSIQRDIKGDKPDRPVIDFSFTVDIQDLNADLRIHLPGRSYTYTAGNTLPLTLSLNLSQMKDSAVISLYSDDPQVYALLYAGLGNRENTIETLDKFKFAFKITNAKAFKAKYCIPECFVYLEVLTSADHSSRFTVTYTVDSLPIAIRDGNMITLPSSQSFYLVHEPAESEVPVSFSTQSESTSIVVYATILDAVSTALHDLPEMLTEMNFKFKTNIDQQNQLVVPRDLLRGKKQRIIVYLLVPKFDIESPTTLEDIFEFYHASDKTRIDVHSHMTKLEPFKHLSGVVKKGDFSFYHFSLDHHQDFTIMLSVLSGEADLYLNQGLYNLTTSKMYWKKATNHRSDEIVVKKEDYAQAIGPVSFNIGVFGRDTAKFSVMVVPEFKNLIAVHFQHMIEMDLVKGEYYYFDFFNKHEKYSTLLFSENSDLEVSALNFDEKNMNTDFLYLIEDEQSYIQSFTFHRGDVPRKNLCNHAVELKTHVIVRIKPLQENAHLNFVIYDSKKPIQVFSERRFTFIQEKDDTHVFQFTLGGEYEGVDVDVKLTFGSIEVWLNDQDDQFQNSTRIDTPSQKYFNFFIDKKKRSNDIVIFDKLFIKITSSESSKFSVYVKPKNRYKEIREFESEIIYPLPDKDQYIFHNLGEKHVKSIHAFSFFLEFVNFYGDKPEFYFNSNTDVSIDENSKLIPMPLIDYIERDKGDFKHIEVRPEIMAGYFVIKIKASTSVHVPIKISMSINNHRNIEINGLYKGSVPLGSSTHSYSMYVPSAGEVRILSESCANIAPTQALFSNRHNSTTITFDDRYNQGFSYINIDESATPKSRVYKVLSLPIRRALIDRPGVLRFEVGKNRELDTDVLEGLDKHYYLVTEFRPNDKELFFKDYVQVWQDADQMNQKKVTYQFTDNNRMLKITAAVPKFKPQLIVDYPSLKKVNIRFFFDLFSEENFETNLNRCGFAILRELPTERKVVEKTLDMKSIAEGSDEIPVEIFFESDQLEKFSEKKTLNIFGTLSISFFDDESEQFHVTLNLKFASVPYFSLIILNKIKPLPTLSSVLFISAFVMVIVILLLIFFYITRKGNEEQVREKKYAYSSAGDSSHSKLEMSSTHQN